MNVRIKEREGNRMIEKEELVDLIQSLDNPALIQFILAFVKRLIENWKI